MNDIAVKHDTALHLAAGTVALGDVEGCPGCDAVRGFCARCRRAGMLLRHWCDFRAGRDPSYDTPTDVPCACPGPHYH